MSEIVAATASEVLQAVASTPGQAAGQSIEQWLQDAQMIRQLQEMGSQPVYKWNYDPAADEAFSKIVDETSADGAWQAWKEGGGNVSTGGNAGPSPTVKATPETAMKGSGAAAASAGGLLSMSLPTWTAAAAPLLGVAIGVGMYELSPAFWEKVSRALLPFCYDDTEVMPVVTDADGNTYIDKEAVEALKQVFEEEGLLNPTGYHYDGPAQTAGNIDSVATGGGTLSWKQSGTDMFETLTPFGDGIIVAKQQPDGSITVDIFSKSGTGGATYVDNYGRTGTYGTESTFTTLGDNPVTFKKGTALGEPASFAPSWSGTGNTFNQDFFDANANYQNRSIGTILYEGTETGDMPEGTEKWSGDKVDFDNLPTIDVYTDPEDSTKTKDFIPVALPTQPGQSVNPTTNPDPTTNSDPESQIAPYILPTVPKEQFPEGSDNDELDKNAPIPMPFPNPQPKPDTEANPTEPDDTPPGKLVDILPGFDPGVPVSMPSNPTLPTGAGGGDGGVGGLVSVYNPTYSELQSFSQWLWVTYADATIDKIWNNPFDGIISLHEFYATPNKGATKYIKSGFLVSPVESITIPDRYSEINCGTAIFPEFYGNYLDYSPYSKALCYLPFIGIVELNVDDIVGHAVNITYHVDSYSGACIALLQCTNDKSDGVLYQFSGNCSVQLPIAGGTQAAIKAAQISAGAYQNAYHIAGLAGLAGGVASGLGSLLSLNLGGALTGAVNGIGSYMSNQAQGQAAAVSQTVSAKSSVQHSGQFGESFGAMGNKKPYMILKRPIQVQVPNYQSEYGYPAHKYVNISECTGYIRCRGVHVLSARATDAEKHMIEQALTEGVYVT